MLPGCQRWPACSLADLEHPGGMAKAGRVPGALQGQRGTSGQGQAVGGDVQGKLKEQKVGQFPLPLPEGSLFHPPSAGIWKAAPGLLPALGD